MTEQEATYYQNLRASIVYKSRDRWMATLYEGLMVNDVTGHVV